MTPITRRGSEAWARAPEDQPVMVDVLIPTIDRVPELGVTLAGLAAQDEPAFRVVISDQSAAFTSASAPAVQAMVRVLRAQGRPVDVLHHAPPRGLAEQRQFLLDRSRAEAVLYLDDDVWLEPGALSRLHDALRVLGCGFVGSAPQGLSYLTDPRPQELTRFEEWGSHVEPERVRPGEPAFERWPLHNAANLAHLAVALEPAGAGWTAYKIAWVGGCVLYDRAALVECGGFDFWPDVPAVHSGEDVAAQWRVMERFGGAGVLPSGAVHLEAPTTIPDRPVDAFDIVFPDHAPAPATVGADDVAASDADRSGARQPGAHEPAAHQPAAQQPAAQQPAVQQQPLQDHDKE